MAQYISKSAVVAEIERRKKQFVSQAESFRIIGKKEQESYFAALASNMNSLSCFIDTIEIKEVDLEKELDAYTADNFWALEGNNESPYLVEKDDMLKVAKHFFELGLKTKDVNEIIKTAEDHAYFAGSENTREKLIEKACNWLKENKDHPFIGCEDCCLSGFLTDEFIEEFRKEMEE